MIEDPAVEGIMEACVEAAAAAKRANDGNGKGAPLTADDVERLNKLEATASRLTRASLDSQRSLLARTKCGFGSGSTR
jgi:hypothetical protein